MPKRSRKNPPDINSLAAAILAEATDTEPVELEKNPAAVALGRLGGLKGGIARAKVLTSEQRKATARKAAAARWGKK